MQEVDEFRNIISGFRILEDYIPASAIAVDGPIAIIGGHQLHVFITEEGRPHAGTLNDLKPVMHEFIDRCPDKDAVILQIHELTGTEQEKRSARLIMRNSIDVRSGPGAAYAFYEGATLQSTLWGRLLKSAPDEESAKRILKARSKVSAHVRSDGTVTLDLAALDPRDMARIDSNILRAELASEFAPAAPFLLSHPGLGGDIRGKIGRQLREMYNEVIDHKSPDRFAELLNRLERQNQKPNNSLQMDKVSELLPSKPMPKVTGRRLNRELSLGAKQARYHKDGDWYDQLFEFPGVLFDRHGYVLFNTREDYKKCSKLRHPEHARKDGRPGTLDVPSGISSIRQYVRDDRVTSLIAKLQMGDKTA